MERTCQVQLLAEAAGTPVNRSTRRWPAITATRSAVHFACWFSFQPLFDKIVAEQPDLLE